MTAPRRTPWLEIVLATLPAVLHALLLLGRLHPDEVFQSLEVAFHKVYGVGVVPWEWVKPPNPEAAPQPWGIRNWFVPLIFAGLYRLGDAVGLSSVMARRTLVEIPIFLLHLGMLGAVWRFAARRVGLQAARACLWLVALYGPVVWFAGRTMSESFSVGFLVWGLERLDDDEAGPKWWVLGGVLLGFSEVTRYGSAAAIVPAMLFLLFTRRFKAFAAATLGGLTVAVALGALDWFTWGSWFHSLEHYVRFNLTSGAAAAHFGAQPWWAYVPRLLVAPFAVFGLAVGIRQGRARWPLVALFVVSGAVAAAVQLWVPTAPAALAPSFAGIALLAVAALWLSRGSGIFVTAALGYFAIVSATAHKEDRFLYPVLVLLTVSAAPLFAGWASERWKGATRVIAVAVALAGIAFFVFPSPYDVQRKEQFQLIAHGAAQTNGLVLVNEGMWGSPGYFYLGKNVPWCPCDFPHEGCFQYGTKDPRFNRGLSWSYGNDPARDAAAQAAFEAAGFTLLERRGGASYFGR